MNKTAISGMFLLSYAMPLFSATALMNLNIDINGKCIAHSEMVLEENKQSYLHAFDKDQPDEALKISFEFTHDTIAYDIYASHADVKKSIEINLNGAVLVGGTEVVSLPNSGATVTIATQEVCID
jgi:hypothetical protein